MACPVSSDEANDSFLEIVYISILPHIHTQYSFDGEFIM